jgi:hypothetical protein
VKKLLLLAGLAFLGMLPGSAQVAILHIQVIEGEGAVHQPGSRSLRALTVEITSETGKPVEGAAVSFHLPEEGPGGTFANLLRTDVVITDVAGHASLRGLQLNHTAGPFQIRIVATKEQARAGAISAQYIAEPRNGKPSTTFTPPATAPTPATPAVSRSPLKWIVIAVAAGGAATAVALLTGKSAASTPAAIPAAPTIGTPTITVGKP